MHGRFGLHSTQASGMTTCPRDYFAFRWQFCAHARFARGTEQWLRPYTTLRFLAYLADAAYQVVCWAFAIGYGQQFYGGGEIVGAE